MDNSYNSEFQFLDLTNLDENGIDELTAILKPTSLNDNIKLPWDKGEPRENHNDFHHNHEFPEQQEIQEVPKDWHQYEMEENMMKYETETNTSSSVLVSVPPTMHYSQQIMAPVYQEWPQNTMYINNMPGDPNVPQYAIPGIAYTSNLFATPNENQEIPMIREGGRRGRGRGNKSYNRSLNHTSDIHTAYMGEHHYSIGVPYQQYVCYDTSIAPQQHPAAGQPIYFPPNVYHAPPMAQQAHRVDYIPHHQSPTNTKYSRQSQSLLPQINGESTKSTNHKSYEKRLQNVNITKPSSVHQSLDEDNNSPQTNIVTRVIVNNSNIESSVTDVNEYQTANNNTSNKKFDFKIEQHIVSTINNDNFIGVEANDIPCVNIKSSIEVKQNGNDNKDYENEAVPASKTPTLNATPKVAAKTADDEIKKKEIKEKPLTGKVSEEIKVSVSSLPSTSVASKSWANVLKKNSDSNSTGSINKPTAFIPPNNVTSVITDQTETSSNDKIHQTLKSYQNKSSPSLEEAQKKTEVSVQRTKSTNNETSQTFCDDPITYRMGEFLLSYQIDKQTVSLLPRGLTNRSNYCYINSILQALLACPPFYNLLMALPYSKNPSRHSPSPLLDNMIKFVREFTPLPEGSRLARKDRAQIRNEDAIVDIQSGVPFEPSYIYNIIKSSSSSGVFSVEGRQEDAEEFLSCLLNGINDEMLELMKLANNNDQKAVEFIDTNVNYKEGEEEWKVMGPKNKGSITRSTDFGRTPLSDIFRGQLRSRVCRASDITTDNVEPFFTLQLNIEKAESVNSALEILVGKDRLEGMTCSKTKQQIEAWKQVLLEELPVIFILHLKWFDYKPDGCSKIIKSVKFPIELKIDNKLISTNVKQKISPKQKQYKLFAVTYHDGKEATKGHYVTDAFHVGYGGWVRYDDSSLKGVSEANVLNPLSPRVPYLLYYRRCDTIGNNQSNNVKAR